MPSLPSIHLSGFGMIVTTMSLGIAVTCEDVHVPVWVSKKRSRQSTRTLSQRRHTDGQQIHDKMFNVTTHQGNANQNHSEIPPHTCRNGYFKRITSIDTDVEKKEPLCAVDGNINRCNHCGKQYGDPSKNGKNRTVM